MNFYKPHILPLNDCCRKDRNLTVDLRLFDRKTFQRFRSDHDTRIPLISRVLYALPLQVASIVCPQIILQIHLYGCFQKYWYPKMDGENNGKPYEQMDDLGVPLFLETPIYHQQIHHLFGTKRRTEKSSSLIMWTLFLFTLEACQCDACQCDWRLPNGCWTKNRGKTPQIIHFNRIFHYFHHPFWGFSTYFWKHPNLFIQRLGID